MSKLHPHRVLRPFCIGGERVEVDSLVELGVNLGAELRAAGKVERVEGKEPDKAPATAQPAADPQARVIKAAKAPKAAAASAPPAPPPETA